MSLNPIQFGKQVLDQFGRYLITTFPIADENLANQFKNYVKHDIGGKRFLSKGPYVYLNQPFESGPILDDLINEPELNLHPALKGVFRFESLYKHQELAIRAIVNGKNTIVATGTGSGKTEGFLLPIINDCFKKLENKEKDGVTAVLVYPMNALVNDQMKRLRPMLAGTKITFGKYTGETPKIGTEGFDRKNQSERYSKQELEQYDKDPDKVSLPWEECVSIEEIQERKPRILLTNYKQLEYLLLRDKDLDLFRNAPIKFLVFDEVHTYTGVLGAEVACLIRRLKTLTGKKTEDIICIGTSATVGPDEGDDIDTKLATKKFGYRLFGVPMDSIEIVTEILKPPKPLPTTMYTPELPKNIREILDNILTSSVTLQLQDEVDSIPDALLANAEQLCGNQAPSNRTNMERLATILQNNKVFRSLDQIFDRPIMFSEALPRIRHLEYRKTASEEDLVTEIMAYLLLGAMAKDDNEPLLRPKLHYFLRGLSGAWCIADPKSGWKIVFDEKRKSESNFVQLPLYLCQSCGQHYFRAFLDTDESVADTEGRIGIRSLHVPDERDNPSDLQTEAYLTDTILIENDEYLGEKESKVYMCVHCGTIHSNNSDKCLNDKCVGKTPLKEMLLWNGELTQCRACSASKRGERKPIRYLLSSEVSDVMILAQSMLAIMPEKSLQKVLIFADNRQDAAFQAGWMDERSKRFRLRHLLYKILSKDEKNKFSFQKLNDELMDESIAQELFYKDDENNQKTIRWFLLEEFATQQQQRSSLENLGMAGIFYEDLTIDDFIKRWAVEFGLKEQELVNTVQIILDYYRRRGILSDPLLQRHWKNTDREVWRGIITPSEYQFPHVLMINKGRDDSSQKYVRGLLSSNNRSSSQVIMKKAVKQNSESINDFLKSLLTWLKDREILVPAKVTRYSKGKVRQVDVPGIGYQVSIDKIKFSYVDKRLSCNYCRTSQAVSLPTNACPEYNCKGITSILNRDEENYDVVQYSKMNFVPLRTAEHSAQVPKEDRLKYENEFKSADGKINCIVCTPTLELGVDIGKLEMIILRNVPPTPANYIQRSGRAGRRHRIAVVFTYCRSSQHDRYFFKDPPAMISGEVRLPAFSLTNIPLIQKHVHSTVLTTLREMCKDKEKDILDDVFPTFIWKYFSEKIPTSDEGKYRYKYFQAPFDVSKLKSLVTTNRDLINERIKSTFYDTWPEEDLGFVELDILNDYVDEMPNTLQLHISRLWNQINTYNRILRKIRDKVGDYSSMTEEEKLERKRYENAREAMQIEDQRTYALSFLSEDGFLPGYALSRDSCVAQCFDPYQEIVRPVSIALRELTPANAVYANKNVFIPRKINFYKVTGDVTTSEDLSISLFYDPGLGAVYSKSEMDETPHDGKDFYSIPLAEVEMDKAQTIDDKRDIRRRVGMNIFGSLLVQHGGGYDGSVGQKTIRHRVRQGVRLVNIGPKRLFAKGQFGFLICPICGETRSPFTSEGNMQRFIEGHKNKCGKEPNWFGLHTEMISDTVSIGPYTTANDAINLAESLRIGARLLLDMGATELDVFCAASDKDCYWAVLYDPMPGGSGFLDQIIGFFPAVIKRATKALKEKCDCEKACYSCMLHFRNQQYHDDLDRHLAINLLSEINDNVKVENEVSLNAGTSIIKGPDEESPAEKLFFEKIKEAGFPEPVKQYDMNLPGGDYTRPDFAYPGANKGKDVLIYIDSTTYHDDPERKKRDKYLRTKAKMEGHYVMAIFFNEIKDETKFREFLDELAVVLGVTPSGVGEE